MKDFLVALPSVEEDQAVIIAQIINDAALTTTPIEIKPTKPKEIEYGKKELIESDFNAIPLVIGVATKAEIVNVENNIGLRIEYTPSETLPDGYWEKLIDHPNIEPHLIADVDVSFDKGFPSISFNKLFGISFSCYYLDATRLAEFKRFSLTKYLKSEWALLKGELPCSEEDNDCFWSIKNKVYTESDVNVYTIGGVMFNLSQSDHFDEETIFNSLQKLVNLNLED